MKYNFDKVIDRKNSGSLKWGIVKKAFNDENIIPLWVADMDFEVPKEVTKALINRAKHPIYGYPYRVDEYYESLIYWYFKNYNLKIEKSNIFYSPGVVPAIYLSILAFTKPSDKIIVQTPVYYPFFQAVENTGRSLIINKLKIENNRYTIDFDNLYEVAKNDVKALIFCSPHNPVGRVWEKEELEKLLKFCIEKNILIISDEIHCDLILEEGKTHLPTVSICEKAKDIVITLTAPNKTFNIAGLTSGNVLIFNEELGKNFQKTVDGHGLGVSNVFSIPAQIAAYKYGQDWLNQLKIYLKENYNYIKNRLSNMPKIKLFPLEATYLAWLDCRDLNLSDDELFSFFTKEAKILLNEGRQFGPGGEGFARLNFATSRKILKIALDRLEKAYSKRFKN